MSDDATPSVLTSGEPSVGESPVPVTEAVITAAPEAPPPAEAEEAPEPVRKHPVAPALIAVDRIDADDAFRFRAEGDVAKLATDIARLGQLYPIDLRLKPPDRFQIITGFRRFAALTFLHRENVLARLHTDLSDDDALAMALAEGIHSSGLTQAQLTAAKESLADAGRLSPVARDMIDRALATDDGLAPEEVESESEEVDADELSADVTVRLGQINQDLSLLADVFGELDDKRRDELLKQLRYSAELVSYLESLT